MIVMLNESSEGLNGQSQRPDNSSMTAAANSGTMIS
jgi:hypothetical protein